MKTLDYTKDLSKQIIDNGLLDGEEFALNHKQFKDVVLKVIDAYPDETGQIPCSTPMRECAFYGCLCKGNGCLIGNLSNENKLVVGHLNGIQLTSW